MRLCRPHSGRHRPRLLLRQGLDSCTVHQMTTVRTRVMLMSFIDLESNLIRDRVETPVINSAKLANIPANRAVRNLESIAVREDLRGGNA